MSGRTRDWRRELGDRHPSGTTALKLRAEAACRLCGRPDTVRQLTRHRLVPGRLGGRYVKANVVPLCRPCHAVVDGPDDVARLTARRVLRASMWPEEVAHARRLMGAPWLDREYPTAIGADARREVDAAS